MQKRVAALKNSNKYPLQWWDVLIANPDRWADSYSDHDVFRYGARTTQRADGFHKGIREEGDARCGTSKLLTVDQYNTWLIERVSRQQDTWLKEEGRFSSLSGFTSHIDRLITDVHGLRTRTSDGHWTTYFKSYRSSFLSLPPTPHSTPQLAIPIFDEDTNPTIIVNSQYNSIVDKQQFHNSK
eukprot:gnl/Dysnectes_brevis/777_a855_2196.p1 GENE.gnl/Dysnectes_brevis/777_a855_2196~~gnl/Dysnectes_brevis/777_a855_2196.p1  ORF type:complete len:183 (+),score=5.84 gnl/Dysnectes_brevis/777_a855_2196:472-1020(+)